MSRLRNLAMLRMSRNQLGVIEDIANLVELRTLSNLTLEDNPITAQHDVATVSRAFAVHTIPSLAAVSSRTISPQEREDVYRQFTTGTGYQALGDAQVLHPNPNLNPSLILMSIFILIPIIALIISPISHP